MVTHKINHKNIYYPTGGILIWIIIFLELITFGIALIAMVYYGKQLPELFHDSSQQLNIVFGTINTFFNNKRLLYGTFSASNKSW